MPSAQIDAPPSGVKQELIRAFLRLTGLQGEIDNGRVLGISAGPGTPIHEAAGSAARSHNLNFGAFLTLPDRAIQRAYEKHRSVWQAEYEQHLNWEFTEEELLQIVAFFECAAGQHYREAGHRMKASIGTNTEHLLDEIVRNAVALLPQLAAESPSDASP